MKKLITILFLSLILSSCSKTEEKNQTKDPIKETVSVKSEEYLSADERKVFGDKADEFAALRKKQQELSNEMDAAIATSKKESADEQKEKLKYGFKTVIREEMLYMMAGYINDKDYKTSKDHYVLSNNQYQKNLRNNASKEYLSIVDEVMAGKLTWKEVFTNPKYESIKEIKEIRNGVKKGNNVYAEELLKDQ